jgi:hypothetical protein
VKGLRKLDDPLTQCTREIRLNERWQQKKEKKGVRMTGSRSTVPYNDSFDIRSMMQAFALTHFDNELDESKMFD